MIDTKEVDDFMTSWHVFKEKCAKKAKDKCKLNTHSWKKLSEYHLESHLESIESPFGFLFKTKVFRPDVYYKEKPEMNWFYEEYLRRRNESFFKNNSIITEEG